MLTALHIEQFALIESLDLDFQRGLTVMTGETGVGKSILIEALALCLGQRAESRLVRPGADRAEIHAHFDVTHHPVAQQWLIQHELMVNDKESDDSCILRRIIFSDGKSRAYINGIPVPAQRLTELRALILHIHGQHEQHHLLKRETHRQLLDQYGKHHALLAAIKPIAQEWQQWQHQLERLKESEEHSARMDLLRYQLEELVSLELGEDEVQRLQNEYKQLQQVQSLLQGANHVLAIGREEEQSVENNLHRMIHYFTPFITTYPKLKTVIELLEQARINTSEAMNELDQYLEHVPQDPERLNQIDDRLNKIDRIARKHKVSTDKLFSVQQTLEEQLRHLEKTALPTRESIDQHLHRLETEYQKHAEKLSAQRKKTAQQLSKAITDSIHQLGMPQGFFEVRIEPTALYPHAQGAEDIEFYVSLNPGHPPQPLQKVASGGELSRISLAIQVLTSQQTVAPTLIFDEVDTGIGGRTAALVGQHLRALAAHGQVLCVTHLPQVAAYAHQHLQIHKSVNKGTTKSQVSALSEKQRVEELARMLGGTHITEETLKHAEALLLEGSE